MEILKCFICFNTAESKTERELDFLSVGYGHVFHRYCINKTLKYNSSCPLCNKIVCEYSITKLYLVASDEPMKKIMDQSFTITKLSTILIPNQQ